MIKNNNYKYHIVSNLARVKLDIVMSLITIYFGANYIGNFEFYYSIRSLTLSTSILKSFNGCTGLHS